MNIFQFSNNNSIFLFNMKRPVTEEMIQASVLLRMVRYNKLPYYQIHTGKENETKQSPKRTTLNAKSSVKKAKNVSMKTIIQIIN